MSPVRLGTIIVTAFLLCLLFRPLVRHHYVLPAQEQLQSRRALIVDFCICFIAGILINIYNAVFFDIPAGNLMALMIGCIIAGFFIGLDSSLTEERQVIHNATTRESDGPLPKRFFSITRKFTLVSILTTIFVALVLTMVFTRDVVWLSTTAQDADSIIEAQLSVTYEIIFIMSVLLVLVANLIFSYSRNLALLFQNQTRVLEQVRDGDLSAKVAVATNDEFGIIARHTNHMIDGLRHRFELISSLQLAEEVQQNLLPDHSPLLAEYDISGISIYCDETGGDYYDYFQLPDNKLGIVVADACGHGIGAAMLMTSVRAFITAAISNYREPAQLLHEVNLYITRDCSKTGRFTTMFFLEIDTHRHTLQWVRGGHEPAIVYLAETDSFSKLDGPGLVLGIDDDFKFENNQRRGLSHGDIILIGTDGIHESHDKNGDAYGPERIKELIRAKRSCSARELRDALVNSVAQHRGEANQEDDITLVVIKAVGRQPVDK